MQDFFGRLVNSHEFMPHGHCYLWNPALVWLHVISDGLTGVAYMTIPFTLLHFVRRRRDLPFRSMFVFFGAFIVACGATHFMEIWTLWTPNYWLAGAIKAVTAAASIVTAWLLVRLAPEALALPSPAELRATNAALLETSRAKSAFLATMSHELRTPLNSILGFSELMVDEKFGPISDPQRRFAENIHSSGTHLLALITDLLDLSKIEAGKLTVECEPCKAEAIASQAIASLQPQAELKHIQVNLEASTLPSVLADPVRYRQALYNLVSNAIKFTPAAGRVTVRFRPTQGGTFVRTEVEDTGPGLSEEDLLRLFRPFVQLTTDETNRRVGTGLGLAITKQLVELMAGRVGATSTPGRGSTFYVDLPVG